MMYHFMFGLCGTSAVAAAPSAWGSPAAASCFASCVWSCILKCFFPPSVSGNEFLMTLEIVEHVRNAVLNEIVDHSKVQREQEYRDDNHRGRGLNFLERRRGHLAHLGTHVVVKSLDAIRPCLHRGDKCVLFRHGCHLLLVPSQLCLLASLTSRRPLCAVLNSGRGGGIRTPKFGFGDRQFNR